MTGREGKYQALEWTVGYGSENGNYNDNFVPATVPGAVQADIARAENYPDLTYSDNSKMFGRMEDMHYCYRASFPRPAGGECKSECVRFVSKGIDYRYDIYLNGRLLHSGEGMFTPVDIDLTADIKDINTLEVRIHPAPKRAGFDGNRQASDSVKPAVSYGWDWHPRLIPLGIWDETYIEVRPVPHIDGLYVDYTLSPDLSSAEIILNAETTSAAGCRWTWILKDPHGKEVLRSCGTVQKSGASELGTFTLDGPELWWPHDHGSPALYTSEFTLDRSGGATLQRTVSRVGFRRVRLVMNEGAWDEPSNFPKTRSVAPSQFEVNGRRIFAKGTNWVNPEIFPGTITRERYEELLALAVGANFNIVRVWGGGIVNKESFYELCDEAGILVWQEFPLACNNYPDEPHYLETLSREAVSIITRLRRHPCLALWSGGNELFNVWSGMTDQSLALRLLNALCLRLDPHTPYIPTAPVCGMAHGNYVFKWNGAEVFESMAVSRYTAYSEFGMPGMAPREVLERIIPPEELFPPRPGGAWEHHHAFGAWDVSVDTWLCGDILEEYFGPARDLDELIERSQTLQCIGYKAIYEEARRQKPYCSMALNWCFNEPWPAAANNSLVAWPAIPKPALAAVADSCRPVCAVARFPKLVWREGEEFFAEIWILNDIFAVQPGLRVKVSIVSGDVKTPVLEWDSPELTANTNLAGPTARCVLPRPDTDRFTVAVEVEGRPELGSEYTMLYRRA